tara:strand:+ start:244 stop:591 length:348 start_codon:yes stop_codon:yes gene_type:complete
MAGSTKSNIRFYTGTNRFIISGNVSEYVKKMKPKLNDDDSKFAIKTIMTKYHPTMPYHIQWEKLTKENILFCIRPDNGQYYMFDLSQKHNIENDYFITKIGIHYFHDLKYNLYLV